MTVSLSDALGEAIQAKAAATNRSVSNMVETLLYVALGDEAPAQIVTTGGYVDGKVFKGPDPRKK
jgi:uncharacterized membrane protein